MKKSVLIVGPLFVFLVFTAGCPVGGPNTNEDATLPQNDAAVDAGSCGNSECDHGETCETCAVDCGECPLEVTHLTVQQMRDYYIPETLGQTIADLRGQATCEASHIPDAFCIPLDVIWDAGAGDFTSNVGLLTSTTVSIHNPLILYANAADASTVLAVAEKAFELDYGDVYVIDGGIEAWWDKGWYTDIHYNGLVANYYPVTDGVLIIDTMDATHYDDCHIEDATHLDVVNLYYGGALINGGQALLDMSDPLDNDVLIFLCANAACVASEDGARAAEMLGYTRILHYKHGTEDWINRSGPTVGSACQ